MKGIVFTDEKFNIFISNNFLHKVNLNIDKVEIE